MAEKPLRLAIGSPGQRQSGIWRIWSNPKGDIYVANRCLGGIYKASFHKDRKCQFGFTDEYAQKAEERFGRAERHLEKWVLPDVPIVRAVQILIPESELRESPINENKKITWLPPPPRELVGTISLFISAKNVKFELPADSPNASIVGSMNTEIRTAWITYAFTTLDSELSRIIEYEKHRLNSATKSMQIPPGTRASLWDSKKSHDRHVLELACDF